MNFTDLRNAGLFSRGAYSSSVVVSLTSDTEVHSVPSEILEIFAFNAVSKSMSSVLGDTRRTVTNFAFIGFPRN